MKNFIQKQYRKVENYFLDNADIRAINVQAAKRNLAVSTHLSLEAESQQRQTLKEWQMAVLLATDTQHPNREQLKKLYKNLLLDNHLASIVESRILHSQRAGFKITDQAGNEVEELSELLERTWFEDFIKFTLNSRFEGTQLIELFEIDNYTKELSEVELIPISHFNPIKGIITKNPGDEKGWAYKEGFLRRHYIQAGRDKDLGMLAEIAPVVLGKKMGWGAWLDYLDKYGVGSLFITTEHQDKASLARLENAARRFKATGWLVSNGNEKFEIKGSEAGNPQNFDLLLERANSEMSKRVLGGSGLTDDKAFVGSTEIQFQLAKDRYDSDLLLLKNIINQQLFPRLAQLSPIYAPFATHSFEWEDKSEDKEKLADTVAKLAPHFYMDEEEISQRLGITLTQKSAPEKQSVEKKKTNLKEAFQEIEAYYNSLADACCPTDISIQALDFSKWDAIIDRIAKDLHEGKIKPSDLDQESISTTYSELYEAGSKGYGKDWLSFPADGKGSLPNELKRNLYMFSGAKTYAMLEQLNHLLYDKDGKLRPYNEYEVYARKLNRQYNRNWLQAEWQTARTAAQMAEKWERLQETKDLFPNLVFRTVGDERVRDAHAELDGIIKPIDDEFWSKYYPPLDWRCRCDAVPTAEKPKGEVPKNMPEPNFIGNVGKDAEIFTQKHNFFRLINSNKTAKRNQELMKHNAPFNLIYKSDKSKKLRESIFADKRPDELIGNREVGQVLVDKGSVNVDILAKIDGRTVKDKSNPEYRIDGKLADRKTPETLNYKKTLQKASGQKVEIVVYDLSKNKQDINEALKKIVSLLNNKQKGKPVYPTIKEVYIVSADRKTMLHHIRKKAD